MKYSWEEIEQKITELKNQLNMDILLDNVRPEVLQITKKAYIICEIIILSIKCAKTHIKLGEVDKAEFLFAEATLKFRELEEIMQIIEGTIISDNSISRI